MVNLRSCCLLKIKIWYQLLKDPKSVASVKSIFFFANTFQATLTKSEISKSSKTIDWGEGKVLHKIAPSSFRIDRRCFRTFLKQIRARKKFGFFRWYEKGFYDVINISNPSEIDLKLLLWLKNSLPILRQASKKFELTLDLTHFFYDFFFFHAIQTLEISHFIFTFLKTFISSL